MEPLSAKVTLGRGIDQEQLARAEAAVAALAVDYVAWATRDLAAMRDIAASLAAAADVDRLYAISHDVKGQGGSFGYPLVTAIAGSLCRFLKHLRQPAARARPVIPA